MRCGNGYCHVAESKFKSYLEQIGVDLCGSILDVACGPVSLACLYDDVHGHDNSPIFINQLAERGVSARLADITELDYPPNSFSYVVSFNPPMKPFKRINFCAGIKKFVEDMLCIAREKVIVRSGPLMPHLPPEYDRFIERRGKCHVVYGAKKYPAGGLPIWSPYLEKSEFTVRKQPGRPCTVRVMDRMENTESCTS